MPIPIILYIQLKPAIYIKTALYILTSTLYSKSLNTDCPSITTSSLTVLHKFLFIKFKPGQLLLKLKFNWNLYGIILQKFAFRV